MMPEQPVARELQGFPTRNYPYRARGPDAAALAAVAVAEAPAENVLYRRVAGLDHAPRTMSAVELTGLDDPFGRLLRRSSSFPLSLREVLAALDEGPDALPNQLVFLVADGGHIPWTEQTDRLQRAFRLTVARGAGEFPVLISSSTMADSFDDAAFLQVIGWAETSGVFHFYERLHGTFFWAGMSRHALQEGTRGKGPFDSHVNGSMVMKEMRAPWVHWHGPQAGINEEALAPNDPLRSEPLFRARITAERMETEVVRPGIRRWNDRRVQDAVDASGTWRDVRQFLRQVVTNTTVNLATSEIASSLLDDDSALRVPLTFFLNRDILFDTLGLEPADPQAADIVIPGLLYRDCLRRYDVHRTDGTLRVEGDVHFAFMTPEPAFEDTQLVDAMVQAGLLSPRFVAALTMTDFTNPVFSSRRAALLRHVPEVVAGPNPAAALETAVVAVIREAVAANRRDAALPDSAEREFLAHWDIADPMPAHAARIAAYFAALRAGMDDPGTVDGWFRLMECRRRRFRRRPLAEFRLTTPQTNIPIAASRLRMTEQGQAETIS